ncbi:exodeoxyribonuclease VII large subunit [Brevundimonas sp. S30B]|uniref:exodeoxyribonuclease VII large subunit n=1 Tax=unclassified Brevundimonas TaxID=2622653 RepID=UPI001072B09F|nr:MULTISPECIES: exodeoxyribonuclease VII large subunit [unclassified Brevundimonas]QBX38144.1 exodeoxyribonuclease VII large subunit [Brevundimonas sp. MF30-B]TFW01720.1 exodeoxyribonuclease VII large subunit [Brevundimonas sp. S30B]
MTDDSYVFEAPAQPPPLRDNNPPLSISDLAMALKRTLEDRFGHVRLRGEISKVNRHASGHVYLTLKDDKACIDGVVWKGVARGLGVQPEPGLEVIVTGKITSYPARSSYQIVIESMEAAGAGALLAQLERLKARLREEGLFEPKRKKPLPAFPSVIGVITSPTGAVIRDILHRIAERWPCRVIVWPVVVQGDAACGQVSNAIRGFDAMRSDGPIPRPDLLIVARGGGSVEDLWCFNDEGLARTVAAASIPIISAVGHETDTTLIDFVSDRRAPTPTGAAELSTPVLADLRWALGDLSQRLERGAMRLVDDRRTRLRAAARGLPARPDDLLALPQQRLDHAASRLGSGLQRNVAVHERQLAAVGGRLGRGLLDRAIERRGDRLAGLEPRFHPAVERRLARDRDRLAALARALASLDPARPKPGFARVEDGEGRWVTRAADLTPGQAVRLTFPDGAKAATINGEPMAGRPRPSPRPRPPAPDSQGDLF